MLHLTLQFQLLPSYLCCMNAGSSNMASEIEKVLTDIDRYLSRQYHFHKLKFLAQSVVKHSKLEDCHGVPELYELLKEALEKKEQDASVTVALLRHILQVSGYDRANDLHHFCAEEFNLTKQEVAPELHYYEFLLILAGRLRKKNTFRRLLEKIDDCKLHKSKLDVVSPLDLFNSMILAGALVPNEIDTIRTELITPLKTIGRADEVSFIEICAKKQGDDQNSRRASLYFSVNAR